MATLVQTMLNMADVYKRSDPTKGIADIIEMMNDTSQDILTDWVWEECNDGTKHTHTIRTGLPSVAWGALYEGTPQSKSGTQQVSDTTGFVEAMCTIDKRVLELAGDKRLALRASESRPFIEAMSQELISSLFYYDSATNARHPKGLSARFGVKATNGAGNQIVDAGGVGSDNMSIWFVSWGQDGVCALYPKGTTGGIKQEDKGEQRVVDESGNPYYVEEEMVRAYAGFKVKDWRQVSRIANIDVSELMAGNVDLYAFMRKAYYKMHNRRAPKVHDQNNPGRAVIYANRDALEALDALATNQGAADNFTRLRPMEIEGKEVLSYRGIPIRECDALLNTEAQVT
ncbi:MAG: major capsid protein [Pseudomonadota bacterium]